MHLKRFLLLLPEARSALWILSLKSSSGTTFDDRDHWSALADSKKQRCRDQADRDARYKNQADRSGQSVAALAAAAQRGPNHTPSMDDDAHTTNIHVHPLPAGITKQLLGQHFARFGSVATVKIFWPRDDPAAGGASLLMGGGGPARVTKAGLGGFVAMMDRKGAEKAIKNIDGSEWMGSILRLGWGKPIPIPLRPAFGQFLSLA